ncbi:MAG: thrombospondin type 3 repeat-containing protein [bacterium]
MLFLLIIFLLNNTSIFKNSETYQAVNNDDSTLTIGDETIETLVNKDTDGDGILDWEENLWGTDPTKKETTPGTLDSVAISKIKATNANSSKNATTGTEKIENLTKTDKFSRELFATISSLSQNGNIDATSADQLGSALADQIQNSVQRKVFTIADIKANSDDSIAAIQKYSDDLNSLYLKHQTNKKVLDIIQKLVADEQNVSVLSELDQIISASTAVIAELGKIKVPQTLSFLHLDLMNSTEAVLENITDIKLLDSDPIVAISAITQYQKNTTTMEAAAITLIQTIQQKLNF